MDIQFGPVDGIETSLSVLNIVEIFRVYSWGNIYNLCWMWSTLETLTWVDLLLLGIIPYLTFNATMKWCTNKIFGESAPTLVKPYKFQKKVLGCF
jgi:hypothetical protein